MDHVKVNNLSYSYDGEHDAVSNVSFNIEKGSYTTIIGHNGSGKSTIAKLLVGLLEKKNGTIMIEDLELNQDNLIKIRNKIGIVFQNPDNQFIGSTVRDDIAFGLENHCVEQKDMDPIINEYAAKVNMTDFLDSEPTHLSGGQKQRVAIAGVLALPPDIIIFDESTSMLDPQGKDEIKKFIYHLHENKELTIISITHDIEEVSSSDHVIVMNDGKVVMDGKPDDVLYRTDELVKIQLDVPFALKLQSALAKKGINVGKCLDLESLVDEIWQLSLKK
ncbi:MAG: energy-coupling factor transporter ATPase [Firmicutes bacterium]|nr:energy-coupling factor transporter ATPase [Bacillota bacterium]